VNKKLYILIDLLGFALGITFLAGSRTAAADPQVGEAAYVSMLPYLSTPAGPPQIIFEPFATVVASDTITAITHAGDERLFIVGRAGVILIVMPDGTVLDDPFLALTGNVETKNWEEGMMGLAFHPDFPEVPYFYVSYTPDHGHLRVARFTVSTSNPNKADKSSEAVLMEIAKEGGKKHGNYRVHNAGDMHFGPDGYLYIAIGDGGPDPVSTGTSGDPDHRGQNKNELMGGLLRVDVAPGGSGSAPDCGSGYYTIPLDNPFVDGPGGACDEIWSTGLRNPYRFSFDRLTGEMYIGEVGESRLEEINYEPAESVGGYNFGWACYEGTIPYQIDDINYCKPGTNFEMPIYEYDVPNNCASVIGGYVYRGQKYPALYGRYVFADFCAREVSLLSRTGALSWEQSDAAALDFNLSTFGEGVDGELYAGQWLLNSKLTIFKVNAES